MGIDVRTMPGHLTPAEHDLVYNFTSFGLASMGASTFFFFFRLSSFAEKYRAALCFTGLVTLIAMYHYFRIFNSFVEAYTPCYVEPATEAKYMGVGQIDPLRCDADKYGWSATGQPFNDAYRYVDWLLTVPLLLIAFGYPGENSGIDSTRWTFWMVSMCPFCYIVYTLFIGLKEAQDKHTGDVRSQVQLACWFTAISWCTYPVVYTFPMILGGNTPGGLSSTAFVVVQIGYTVSDVISKCGVGYLVYRIGLAKSIAYGEVPTVEN